MTMSPDQLRALADDAAALQIMHKAIEDALVEFRDLRLSVGAGNGLVIRERSGGESPIIRLTVEDALKIGLEALASHREGVS